MGIRLVSACLLLAACGEAEMVPVPGGEFLMGCDMAADPLCYVNATPPHMITLSPFEIDRLEVTQADFDGCVQAGICGRVPTADWDPQARADHPVRFVDWEQARAYCEWVGKRLPTEAEWEKAARGDDGRLYPWGNEPPDCNRASSFDCPGQDTDPVGSHPAGASPHGVEDMSGNVIEWVNDWYDGAYYQTSPSTDPQGPATGTGRVGRGGCFLSSAERLRVTMRWGAGLAGVCGLGFRCAGSP